MIRKKMFCYMRDSYCTWHIAEIAKIFWSYVEAVYENNSRGNVFIYDWVFLLTGYDYKS